MEQNKNELRELINRLNNHAHLVQTNLRQLYVNVRRVFVTFTRVTAKTAVKQGCDVLWKANRPVTLLNVWMSSRSADLCKTENNTRESLEHRLEIERMDGEGGAMSSQNSHAA